MRELAFILLLAALSAANANADDFEKHFRDSTLRLDYIFTGNAERQEIALDEMVMEPRWHGKKNRLADIPVEGNGQITVRRHATGDTIYRQSFSTLFQEWLTYDEAKGTRRSFENVFLIPMPREAVDVNVRLADNRRETMVEYTHAVDPDDILIRKAGFGDVTPHVCIQRADDPEKCINIAFLAEGYTADEMPLFVEDATAATNALFEHEPFKRLRGRFNVTAVQATSKESGTSVPSKGVWKETALHSHFDTFHSDRYLTTLKLKDMHDLLAGTPYEHIIVLVNTSNYGGGGIYNSFNLAMAHHRLFLPVVVHEFGHSFAGLADEYAYEQEPIAMYPSDVEPWERNITTLKDFHGKWETMIKKGTPIPTPMGGDTSTTGVYEGAGYSLKGVYRGRQNCRMRTNEEKDFCPVCQKALEDIINFYTE